MRKLLSIALISCIGLASSCGNTTSNAQGMSGASIKTVSVKEYAQKLATINSAQLVDVRTPDEYAGGHLKQAMNIDYNGDDFEQKLAKLDKEKPVFVYCHSGRRSSAAAGKMKNMGFKEVYNLEDGISAWEEAKMPIE